MKMRRRFRNLSPSTLNSNSLEAPPFSLYLSTRQVMMSMPWYLRW